MDDGGKRPSPLPPHRTSRPTPSRRPEREGDQKLPLHPPAPFSQSQAVSFQSSGRMSSLWPIKGFLAVPARSLHPKKLAAAGFTAPSGSLSVGDTAPSLATPSPPLPFPKRKASIGAIELILQFPTDRRAGGPGAGALTLAGGAPFPCSLFVPAP